MIPDDDGWIELDEDGIPLGRWDWDDDEKEWVYIPFTPDPPMSDPPMSDPRISDPRVDDEVPLVLTLPQTGVSSAPLWLPIIGAILIGLGVLTRRAAKRRQ